MCSKFREDIRNSRCTTMVNNTRGKFTAGAVDTGDKFTACVNDTGGHTFPQIYIDNGNTDGHFAISAKVREKVICARTLFTYTMYT